MRALRELDNDGIYHVMARGNDKQDIFKVSADYKRYLDYIRKFKASTGVDLYCFVLMPNHIHLTLRNPKAGAMSKFMHFLQTSYSVYFNKKYDRVGHVFQGRFKSKVVKDDVYLVHLTRYLHLNPVSGGLVKKPSDYEWSS